MTQSTTETITFFLEKILNDVHPLMAEGIYLAAIPNWYDADLFAAIRNQDDGRNQGLIERLTRYSFIMRWEEDDGTEIYAVRAEERALIQRQWIAKDPDAYRQAHRRALAYWEAHPDPNPFAHDQNRLYHQLFVDRTAAADYLIDRFRAYHNERQLAAIDRLLDTVNKARFYLTLLNESDTELDDLVTHLQARLDQLRGNWDASLEQLQILRRKESLPPALQPYVTRAYGFALAHTGDFVGAIAEYETALTTFETQAKSAETAASTSLTTLQAEQAQTMIALGDAYVGLATAVHSAFHGRPTENVGLVERFGKAIRPLHHLLSFILSLPLIIYLSFYLGRRVWRPRFWPAAAGLDWIIARLFATGARCYRRADPILERVGDPGEAVAADEKLAYLYLAMGDVGGAQAQFDQLLQETEAPLGEFRRAAVRVGLGQAWLQQDHPAAAREQLELALPALRQYEDANLEATARLALAEALYDIGEKETAVTQFSQAAQLRQARGDWAAATDALERLEALVAADKEAAQSDIVEAAVTYKLPQRQYTTQFHHPLLVAFRRFVLFLLPLVALLMPLFVIRIDTGSALTPIIQFKAAPIFDPSQTVSSQLSQGVTTANVSAATNADLIMWLAIALLVGYVALSLLMGLLLIIFTPLRTVQARGKAATVHLDDEGIRVGGKQAKWADVTTFVKGDMRLWQRPLPDESAFALVTAQDRLLVQGSVNWYPSLRRRVMANLPASTRIIDRDTAVFKSKWGRLYLLNILFIGVLALMTWLAPAPLWWEIPGLPYSLADLYPYFYLGLVILPVWWAVIRPLQTQLHLNPNSRLPWLVLGAGLALALFQTATLYRPLLTAVNLYPPLVTLILMMGAGTAVWRAQDKGRPIYARWMRVGTAVLAIAVSLLMAILLWREVAAYHYLALGNARRDHAQLAENAADREKLLGEAINAYSKAIQIGGTRIVGINPLAATRIPIGLPEPHSFTWLAALTNRATLQVQLGQYPEAMGSFSVILEYTNRPAEIYAWRAIARQSWQTASPAEEDAATVEEQYQLTPVADQYQLALDDFDKAIKLRPRRAVYYLWRGVAYHAINDLELAWGNYNAALKLTGPADTPLTDEQRERAYTGLGWIAYSKKQYAEAQQLFELGTQANPMQAEAWTGLGYAAFSQQLWDEAGRAWEQAFALDPNDPAVLISLGTLHWKLGGLAEGEEAKCVEYERSADFFTRATEAPGQDDAALAFTFRTRGQVQYLIRTCPNRSYTEGVSAAIASYDEAIALDPSVTAYYQMKGRLGYVLWLGGIVEDETAVLLEALTAINEAYRRDPNDQVTVSFRSAILTGLEPLIPAYVLEKFEAGDYETLQKETALLAEAEPDNPAFALQAGLAALAAGDTASAQKWYDAGAAAAAKSEDGAALLTQALADLDALAESQPALADDPIRTQLEAALTDLLAQDPATLFAEGLAALEAGRTDEAITAYQDGLAFAAEKGYVSAVAAALLDLRALPNYQTTRILTLFWRAFPRLEAAGEGNEVVETAVTLGFIAAALEEYDTAAAWYNESIHRTFLDNTQYAQMRHAREELRDLWAVTGVNSDPILQALDAQLASQLQEHAGLADEGYYWRYRTWFKYGLGLSAFRLGDEAAAAAALKSAQVDANRAYQIDPDRQSYGKTYLEESAWGWYHIERGNDAYDAGDYEAALADYAAAAELIKPVVNRDAQAETTVAAFKAGLASAQLEAFAQAAAWYKEGVARADKYDVPVQIKYARDELLEAQSERPELADEIDTLLELLLEQ